jgi:AraC-like DNA-binding protein
VSSEYLNAKVSIAVAKRANNPPVMLARDITPNIDSLRRTLCPYLLDGGLHVKRAAELVGMSRRILQRRLGEAGVSFTGLAQQARIDCAAQRLRTTDWTILDISIESGYQDPSNFSRAFRRMTGVCPQVYRDNHRERIRNL